MSTEARGSASGLTGGRKTRETPVPAAQRTTIPARTRRVFRAKRGRRMVKLYRRHAPKRREKAVRPGGSVCAAHAREMSAGLPAQVDGGHHGGAPPPPRGPPGGHPRSLAGRPLPSPRKERLGGDV